MWLEVAVLIAVALVAALLVKTFLVQAFYIPSKSMQPGLVPNERILVEKPSYWFGGTPQRGDVIVFKDPGGWLPADEQAHPGLLSKALQKVGLQPGGGHLVKRVIGLPGDTVHCCVLRGPQRGELEVNGTPIDEKSFVAAGLTCDGPMPSQCDSPWTAGPVPAGKLFVMGDNRDDSADSSYRLTTCRPQPRCIYLPEDDVVGKVAAIVWPLDRFRLLHRPSVFSTITAPSGS